MATDDSLLRTIVLVIATILLLPVIVMIVVMPIAGPWGVGHMGDGSAWNGTGATWMWLLVSVVPALVLLGVGSLLYRATHRSGTRRSDAAVEALRTAYARGELSDEEFEERRERLQRGV